MSMSVLEIIGARAPQYLDNSRLNSLITLATGMTGSAFDDCQNLAIALRVMHWLALEGLRGGSVTSSGSGQAGSIQSETEGQLSRSWGNGGASYLQGSRYADLSTTVYGQELQTLMDSCIITVTNRMI